MGIKPFTVGITQPVQNKDDNSILPDFTKSIDVPIMSTSDDVNPKTGKKKRSSKSKKTEDTVTPLFTSPAHMAGQFVPIDSNDNKSERELSFLESNEPYEKKYQETNNVLRSAIAQVDASLTEVQGDIQDIRSSRVIKNKYQYLSLLQGSVGSLIANKISAARELNNTISKCNDMELKRYKEIRVANAAMNEQDSDQKVMEMYKAFVSTPVSSNPFPEINQMSVGAVPMPTPPVSIGNVDDAYANYVNNLTPQQNSMYIENNPNIKQVVVYNQETGARYFDVIDMTTGQSIPNTEKHDAMFLEDVDIDLKNNIARNVNIGETYPLVKVGQPLMNEY